MARRFEETVNIQQQNLSTGAVGGILSLSQRLNEFKEQQFQRAEAKAVQRGIESAAKVELEKEEVDGKVITKKPELKEERFIGGIEIRAHNKALRDAYMASLNNDNREAVANIAAENPDNLLVFNDAVEGYRKAVLSQVEPLARQAVAQDLDNKITSARIKVQANTIQKQKNEANAERTANIESASNAAYVAARNGEALESAESIQEAFATIDSMVDTGGMTKDEGRRKKREIELRATQENIVGMVRRVTDDDPIKAIEVIESVRAKPLKGFSLDEQSDLVSVLISDINQSLGLKSKREAEEDDAADVEQEANSQALFNDIITGTATPNDVVAASQRGKINETQARTLINILNTQGTGVDDFQLVNEIERMIDSGRSVSGIIESNIGTRLTQSTAGQLLSASRESIADGSPLQTESYKSALSFLEGSVAVRGPLGALDTESERRLAKMRREVRERVLGGENPWDVVDQIIPKDEFNRAPAPMFGTKENLNESESLLNDQFRAGTIDDDTYNFQFELIQRLKGMKQNLDNFNQANKEQQNVVR